MTGLLAKSSVSASWFCQIFSQHTSHFPPSSPICFAGYCHCISSFSELGLLELLWDGPPAIQFSSSPLPGHHLLCSLLHLCHLNFAVTWPSSLQSSQLSLDEQLTILEEKADGIWATQDKHMVFFLQTLAGIHSLSQGFMTLLDHTHDIGPIWVALCDMQEAMESVKRHLEQISRDDISDMSQVFQLLCLEQHLMAVKKLALKTHGSAQLLHQAAMIGNPWWLTCIVTLLGEVQTQEVVVDWPLWILALPLHSWLYEWDKHQAEILTFPPPGYKVPSPDVCDFPEAISKACLANPKVVLSHRLISCDIAWASDGRLGFVRSCPPDFLLDPLDQDPLGQCQVYDGSL
ncbi:hypothetical protein F5J12DRAFT_943493 [Pisolithus orientalis]|uniref:uncharacterized protein n=1 Tax=Pisolithus orientalis TaxID=936130 RepID=UPI00222489EA|nr:uncharacterized protein F5J12DRAFT_943493 [Pisolithus orientalis]KAI6003521.1 hypothetical protein F5J12DRAFT_943493 [Pisolithus orientalis]